MMPNQAPTPSGRISRPARWSGAGLAALLCLTACDGAVDRQRATLCRRALPALVPEGVTPTLLRVGRGASPDAIRVDYAIDGRPHRILCRFNVGALLLGVSVDDVALTGAALYLFQRHYLDTPDAEAGDPGLARH